MTAGAAIVPIRDAHAVETAALTLPHDDPFDRLLVTVARLEGMLLLTADSVLIQLSRDNPALPIRGA